MLSTPIDQISETDLQELVRHQIPESISVEFKQQLDLNSKAEKAEAAKDVSAMANMVGGRIYYGVEEQQNDGMSVAKSIMPLTDSTLTSRLDDVLNASIHPRPHFRIRTVNVCGGFVLVVQVYPSLHRDLHMVSGFKEYRFYRRSELRTVVMTEPEIREAFMRIAQGRQQLESSLQTTVNDELAQVYLNESIIVIPLFGHDYIIEPRLHGNELGRELAQIIRWSDWRETIRYLKIVSDGYRASFPEGPLSSCSEYVCLKRNGLIHLAASNVKQSSGEGISGLNGHVTIRGLVAGLTLARHMLQLANYWGPVRLIHQVKCGSRWVVHNGDGRITERLISMGLLAEPGHYRHEVPEISIEDYTSRLGPIVQQLMDKLFNTAGQSKCKWFTEDARPIEDLGQCIGQQVYEML